MKVLFLSSWFPNRVSPLNGDFVERHALAVSKICTTSVIHVASDIQIKGHFFEIHEIQKQDLFEIIIYFKRSSIGLFNQLSYVLGYFIGYRMVLKKSGKPDVIHANIIFPVSHIAWLFHMVTRIPYIISEHWTIYLSSDKKLIPSGRLIKLAVKQAFALVPVTRNLMKALQELGYENNYFIVPNVVNTKVFTPSSHVLPGDYKHLIHVSSMKEEQKNISGIIKAVHKLRKIRNDFNFTFIGEVHDEQIQLASDLGLFNGTVIFEGMKQHDEVAAAMQKSHIFVLFSRVENLPCVILEALSCGLPVISSDVGGISEWISDSNGILVKPNDENELIEAMKNMLDNYQKYSIPSLHRFATDNFGEAAIAEKFYTIYNKALHAKEPV
jgi:glycosyltransferase involved in cell wall biosynthesis